MILEVLYLSNYIDGRVVMNSSQMFDDSNYADLHLQQIRNIHITVEVLDKEDNTIETIQGLSTGGNISVSNSSLIRRTGNLSFVLFENLLPKSGNILWMTNKIRVYAGIEDLASSERGVTHFCLGTFYITEPEVSISSDSRTIGVKLEDNMTKWELTELENKMIIEADTPLNTAMTQLLNFYGEWNTLIDFTELKVPYTLEFNEGDTILSVITKLRDLYMDWECFYDIDGTFVFRKMMIQRKDDEPVAWKFDKESDLITSFKETFSYKSVRNRIIVNGQMDEITGLTPRAEASITLESSPFHENNIDRRTKVINDSTYGNVLQCDSRARYELFKQSTFQEKIDISTVPIYFLDANNIIEANSLNSETSDRYVIDSISIGLAIGDEMSIQCHKVYYSHFDNESITTQYRESAEKIINGIENLGWLSLAEDRVKDYYGLEGDGSKVIVRFEYQGLFGITAYVTGYFGETTQTLTIDLADFENPVGDSGDNGTGKAEYSDRVLGHEMLHIVMNNAFGINKSVNLPVWFKEGTGEFIHGADERLKNLIVVNGVLSQVEIDDLVTRATALLNGSAWNGQGSDYVAGYLIVKYLDKKISIGKDFKNLMWSIRDSLDITDLSLKNAIAENTDFATYQDFVANFSANASNFIKSSITLNIGANELDTGSIAGSDHRGTQPLNAESVFDNTLATPQNPAKMFDVQFMRV